MDKKKPGLQFISLPGIVLVFTLSQLGGKVISAETV
jgi:hypothetical protein